MKMRVFSDGLGLHETNVTETLSRLHLHTCTCKSLLWNVHVLYRNLLDSFGHWFSERLVRLCFKIDFNHLTTVDHLLANTLTPHS